MTSQSVGVERCGQCLEQVSLILFDVCVAWVSIGVLQHSTSGLPDVGKCDVLGVCFAFLSYNMNLEKY